MDRPILFSDEMVRAILAGRKSQTRRVIKPQPDVRPKDFMRFYPNITAKNRKHYGTEEHMRRGLPLDFCPYGQVGDRLWVRETWLQDGDIYLYKADFGKGVLSDSWNGHWKPSIHMPRTACRITLEVTNVRVERVQEITRSDAIAEGINPDVSNPIVNFELLWNGINEKRGYGWDVNPWVWVVEFTRCTEERNLGGGEGSDE
jgi:hypothetical protein